MKRRAKRNGNKIDGPKHKFIDFADPLFAITNKLLGTSFCPFFCSPFPPPSLLLGLKGYKPVEVASQVPKLIKKTQTHCFNTQAIYVDGVLYCIRVNDTGQIYDRAIAIGYKLKPIKNFFIHEWKSNLELEDILCLAYLFYSDYGNWDWNCLKNLCLKNSWKKYLTQDAVGFCSFFMNGIFYHEQSQNQLSTNVTFFFQETKIIFLTHIAPEQSISAVLDIVMEALKLHILTNPIEVKHLIDMLKAMQKERLRFFHGGITNSLLVQDLSLLRQDEESHGQLFGFDKTQEWIDPNVYLYQIFPIQPICDLIWQYVFKEVTSPILKGNKIEIEPFVEFINFDPQFSVVNNIKDGLVRTEFTLTRKQTKMDCLNRISNIPRCIAFLHEVLIWSINRHREDVYFVEMLLYNITVKDIQAYINVRNGRFHKDYPYTSSIRIHRTELWTRPLTKVLVNEFEFKYGTMKGVINEKILLKFLVEKCTFNEENHFKCIRWLHFGQTTDLFSKCENCRWKDDAIKFQYGLKAFGEFGNEFFDAATGDR